GPAERPPLRGQLLPAEAAVESTWDGNDEMDPAQGRGWAVLKGDELHGMIFFHQGDDSGFVAKRPRRNPRRGGNCRAAGTEEADARQGRSHRRRSLEAPVPGGRELGR